MKFFRYWLKIAIATIKGYIVDDCSTKASSLSFYTLLSIVPILAVAFGIAKGLGVEKYFEAEIKTRFLEQPLLAEQIISFAYIMLAQVHGGLLATVGVISLIWTSLQLFGSIEYALNVIWGIKSQRSYLRQFSEYFVMLMLGLVFFVMTSTLSVLTIVLLNFVSQKYSTIHYLSPYLKVILGLFPFTINWLLFTFIYLFLPNTKIGIKNAFIAGILIGTIYQCVQWVYIHFQIGVANYGAIYGSFAALPLFLVWVNLSWNLVLLGAELVFQLDMNPRPKSNYLREVDKDLIGLWIACRCTEKFLNGNPSSLDITIADDLDAPLPIIGKILKQLCSGGILIENQSNHFALAKNPNEIKIIDVQNALNEAISPIFIINKPEFQLLHQQLIEFENAIQSSAANLSLEKSLSIIKEKFQKNSLTS